MPIDFGNLEQTIDNFDKGNITRDKFISYLRTQVEQVKTENEQMSKQLEAAQQAAKMAQQNMDRNKEQGVGTARAVRGAQANRGPAPA